MQKTLEIYCDFNFYYFDSISRSYTLKKPIEIVREMKKTLPNMPSKEVIDLLPMSSVLLSPAGEIIHANAQFAAHYDAQPDALTHKLIAQVCAHSADVYAGIVEQVQQQGVADHLEFQLEDKYFWLNVRPIFDHDTQLRYVWVCSTEITRLKQESQSLRQCNMTLKRLSDYDHLSKVLNRRSFDFHFKQYRADMKQGDTAQLCLALIDIDNFKMINDCFGHNAGDRVLQRLSSDLQSLLPAALQQRIYRYGGDEFVILLADYTLHEACSLLEQCRRHIEQSAKLWQSNGMNISLSCGVAHCTQAEDFEYLIEQADQALYGAKGRQKNQVFYYTATEVKPYSSAVPM